MANYLGTKRITIPADFAEVARNMQNIDLQKHYQRCYHTIRDWIAAQDPEWRAAHAIMSAERATQQRKEMMKQNHRARPRVEAYAPRKPRYRVGAVKRAAPVAPDNIVPLLMESPVWRVAEQCGTTVHWVNVWLRALPDRDRVAISHAGKLRAAELARQMGIKQQAKNNAGRPAKEVKPRKNIGPRKSGGFKQPSAVPQSGFSLGQRAVDHLKRYYAPAFNAEKVHGKAFAGVFMVGRMKLDVDGVVALAVKHGFDDGSWQRLAA